MNATILVDSDVDEDVAATIVAGLKGMALKEVAHGIYLKACEAYQAAKDAAIAAETPETLAAMEAADEVCQGARRAWEAL